MGKKNKLILSSAIIATFIVAFLLATFFDYEISGAICRLSGEKYLSDNLFGRFFETFGESPLYLVGAFAGANLVRGSLTLNKKPLKITLTVLCGALGVLALYLLFQRSTEYICEHLGKVKFYEDHEWLVTLLSLILGAGTFALTLYFTFKIPEKHIKGLVAFSLCVLFTVILAQGLVQGVKGVFGRQRFRTIKVLEYYGLNEFVDYTTWFKINGERVVTSEMLALGIASDGYKSFPSGHTCAAAISFTLILLPDFLSLEEKKRVRLKGILYGVTFFYVLLVGLSRIVMGAHYLTDVLFSLGWTYLSVIISRIIVKRILKIS